MTENEIINEARIRLAHNKQRQKLKALLTNASDGGSVVATKDLLLACRIAKLDVGTKLEVEADKFVHPNYIASRDCFGTPRQVNWKGFHKSIHYPELHGPGQYPGDLPLTRRQKYQYKELMYREQEQLAEASQNNDLEAPVVNAFEAAALDDDVRHYHKLLKRAIETRFVEMRRAFRLIDEDNSGDCDRDEMKMMINSIFTFNIPDRILDRIIDLADYDGDGKINFAEFARLATEDDVFNMKKTLRADVGNFGQVDVAKQLSDIDRQKAAAQRRDEMRGANHDGGYHPKLRRTGPGLDELRRAHKTIKRAVLLRFPNFETAFAVIDQDHSGSLRRNELRRFLADMVKTVGDRTITGLIDYCDDDGDGKTLSKREFITLMNAEYLGSGTMDSNVKGRR